MSKALKGYFKIPNFSRYEINKRGDIFDLKTDGILNPLVNTSGYRHYCMFRDDDKKVLIGRHRLLLIVFKPTKGFKDLYVNHINGRKGDDRLKNLEWVTPKENCEHAGALGLSTKCRPIQVKYHNENVVEDWPSIAEYARSIHESKDYVNYRVKTEGSRVFPEGKCYRFKSDEPWPELPEHDYGRDIKVDIHLLGSLEGYTFERLGLAADFIGISHSAASRYLNDESQPVLPGYYLMRKSDSGIPWREVEDMYMEADKQSGNRSVVIFQPKTGYRAIYPSGREACRETGLKPTALGYRLKSDGETYYRGFKYCYYDVYKEKFSPSSQ